MASNLRVDQILPSVGTNVAIGTATGTVTLAGTTSGNFSGNLNVSGGTLSGISTLGVTTAYINTLSGISTISADSSVYINQNLVFSSGKGIDFSATANSSGTMTSELFNDYEEGTWTPYWSNINGLNLFVNNNLTIYHANYVRINDTCFYQAHFESDNSFSYNTGITGSTQAYIAGLPFSPKTTPTNLSGYYAGYCGYYSFTGYDTSSYGFTPMILTENTYPVLRIQYPTVNTPTLLTASPLLVAGSAIIVGGSYKIA